MSFRPSFMPALKEIYTNSSDQNICHVLSWQYISSVMSNLVQNLPETEDDHEVWQASFNNFFISICLFSVDDDLPDGYQQAWDLVQQTLISIEPAAVERAWQIKNEAIQFAQRVSGLTSAYSNATDQASKSDISEEIMFYAWELLRWLNSMPTNLKVGNASWNKSIGAAVDPRAWRFSSEILPVDVPIFATDDDDRLIYDYDDAYVVEAKNSDDEYGFEPLQDNKSKAVETAYCELTHPTDQAQITAAFNIDPKFVQPETYLYTGVYETEDKDHYITVCSSSNRDCLVNSSVKSPKVPILVKNPLSQQWYEWY